MPPKDDPKYSGSNRQVTTNAKRKFLDEIARKLQKHKWSIGTFMEDLLTIENPTETHSKMVEKWLRGETSATPVQVMEMIYTHKFSQLKSTRSSDKRTAEEAQQTERGDPDKVAKAQMERWAVGKVVVMVDRESKDLASHDAFHISTLLSSWSAIFNFTMEGALTVIRTTSPTLLCVASAAAGCSEAVEDLETESGAMSDTDEELRPPPVRTAYHSRPIPSGRGNNPRDPILIVLTVCMMLMAARSVRFNLFQKVVSVWMFSHTAPHGMYAVLGRLGLSVSYTTTLRLLRSLSKSAQETNQAIASTRAFLLIYDNINRMVRSWDADYGIKDTIQNGTAATMVELEVEDGCDLEKVLDPEPLRQARAERRRENLTLEKLYEQVKWTELKSVMASHALLMLIDNVPCLAKHRPLVLARFKTTHGVHRMRAGRKSKVHPMATSDHNEGNTAENAKVLEDLLIHQLGMSKEAVAKIIVIIGGDQSTVEKLRTLQKLRADCPHEYERFDWALPLIQLWHMGWADLERILNTHWGTAKQADLSSFLSINFLLGRTVKDVKRPDYYPALHLLCDTLIAAVLDCWRIILSVPEGSDLAKYLEEHPTEFEDLLTKASTLVATYMTGDASARATEGGDTASEFFKTGRAWPGASEGFIGDYVLRNSILRLRDCMLHYEFQHAIADGDIGRVRNVMAVWVFTFTGCGKNKYANELLELACFFLFECSEELQKLILDNWLCNLLGVEGHWMPMDLLQEKNIKQLKKMSQKRSARFGGSFFKDVIAVNIRAFIEAIKAMKTTVRIAQPSEKHEGGSGKTSIKVLGDQMEEKDVHTFRPGRDRGHKAQDDFETGYLRLDQTSRIEDFVARTLRDFGVVYDEGEADETDSAPAVVNILPSVIVDGHLVIGDDRDDILADEEPHPDGMDGDDADGEVDEVDAVEGETLAVSEEQFVLSRIRDEGGSDTEGYTSCESGDFEASDDED